MNAAYGYAIARTGTCQALGVPDVRPERYRLCARAAARSFAAPEPLRWCAIRSATAASAAGR